MRCKVLESDPHKRLRYSWQSGPASSPLDTVVTWTLTPTPSGGTRLTLEHSGFVPTRAAAFEGARQGWQRMVGKLIEVLARGEPPARPVHGTAAGTTSARSPLRTKQRTRNPR